MTAFNINVYDYDDDVDNISLTFRENWTSLAKDLVFSTKAPGGFAECSFRINTTNEHAYTIYSAYHHFFVRITDGAGILAWQGRIASVTYEPGQATVICEGLWASMFDSFYDDGSFSGDPATEHSIINADGTRYIDTATYKYMAQSFQLDEALAIRDIAIRLVNDGAPAGSYITAYLIADQGGSPSTNPMAVLASIDIQCETIGSVETIFTGLNTSYRLNANTSYWIVIGSDQTVAEDNVLGWRYDTSSGYADGSMKYYTSGWNAYASGDAIFYVYTHPRFYYYSVDFENGDFEDNDGSTFEGWLTNTGDGIISVETSNVYEGASAVKLTAGSSADTFVYQDFVMVSGSEYTLSFYTRGDGTYAGRYGVQDITNMADIVAATSTAVTGTTYTLVENTFTVPATCDMVRIYLLCPSTNGGIAYFDYASIDGDFSSSADVIYDAITQSNFVQDSTGYFQDFGTDQVNPIAFTNNERPGDVVGKITAFGSTTDGETDALFAGIYNDAYMYLERMQNGKLWRIGVRHMPAGQQAMSMTTSLDGMKTRVSVLYSGTVGERNLTTWVPITPMSERFGYNRDGVYSIAGATEATADIITDVVASVYSKPSQTARILVGPVASDDTGGVWPSHLIRAGDVVRLENVTPDVAGYSDESDGTSVFSVLETSYDAETGRLSIVPGRSGEVLLDIILALAGLSGGSMI